MTSSTLDHPPPASRPLPSADAIGGKLRGLRRRITLWVAIDGICRVMLVAVLLIGLDLALDWSFSMDRPQRMVVMVLMFAALCVVAYRCLWRPLTRTMSDDALCLLVERRYQELGEGLISAVQLSRQGAADGGASPELVAATIELGVQSALPLPFHGVLRQRRFAINLLAAIALVGVLGGIAVAVTRTETMSIWFDRNIRLADRSWPQDFYLTFDGAIDNVLRVPRAEPWPLGVSLRLAREDVKTPDDVSLEVRGAGDFHSERMDRGEGGHHFSGTLPAIDGPAQVRASAPGGNTGWVRVEPVDRPLVTGLTLQVTPPKYAGAVQQSLAEGKGPYAVLPGSRLHIRGTVNKPLSQAALALAAQQRQMKLEGDNAFSVDFIYAADAAGIYAITLTDTEQIPGASAGKTGPLSSRVPTQFMLRTQVDRPPLIKLRLPGIGALITTRARLPVVVTIDDDHAVADAELHWKLGAAADGTPGRADSLRPAEQDKPFGSSTIKLGHLLDVGALKTSAGVELTLEVTAKDNNDVTGPGKGSSGKTVLRVVADDEFRAELLRREREQREEIERLLKTQLGLIADTKDLVRAGAEGKPWTAATEQAAARVARQQKAIGNSLALTARRIDDLLIEAANNRLEEQSGPLKKRLGTAVHDRLVQTADKSVPDATARLEEARRVATQPKDRDTALEAALAGQEKIEKELSDVLKHMITSEDYQFILSLIMEIQRGQGEVHDRAKKQLQEHLDSLFDKGGAGKSGAAPR